ncbi:WxL domain-containing protein [Vagococcus silagei]|uniref:WxL domain-containing protein n=1 Tax=Vagococcus silagei TaxID=2508885 RepID=A0A4S3B3G1_9ENTE|nr:WxL domain-containing protein [Vagococcus silagei]THB60103.1 WxL domain-containing protein [Vagococcus silagei]
MKKRIVFVTFLLCSFIGLISQETIAAESPNIRPQNSVQVINKEVHSSVKVTLNPGDEDETDPEEPNEPNDPDPGTHQKGPLSIDQVIKLDFEDRELASGFQRASLKAKGPQNIQVTDKRGTGKGWSLQVKQGDLTSVESPDYSMKGAYIDFPMMRIQSGKEVAKGVLAPVANDVAFNEVNKKDFAKIMTATDGQGMGTWLGFYNEKTSKKQISLVIPTGGYKGAYKGNVTWLLSEGPIVYSA